MNLTRKKIIKGLFLSLAICSFSSNAIAQSELCVNKACLGMTLEEASKLPLLTASALKFEISENRRGMGYFGLDLNGKRLYFTGQVIDKSTINLLRNKVKTICSSPDVLHATLLASDGEPILIFFGLTSVEGSIKWTVKTIQRRLPSNISKSEMERFKEDAKNRYGNYWEGKEDGLIASIGLFPSGGWSLYLKTPYKAINSMEQKGCSDKLSID